jgi:hypothetical protein
MKTKLTFFLILLIKFCSSQDCSFIKNGSYKADYDTFASIVKRTNPQTRYEFFNDTCYIFENNHFTRYNIIRTGNCGFQLKNFLTSDTTGLTNSGIFFLKKQQDWVYVIKENKNGTYDFELIVGVHVRSQSGRFIRIESF